ncbi:hypothetical protein C8F04DRAFT_969285 [Mycena alexandri]|uniref:Uncharacterized protein n=1 Tax=Mycena alexandri TaxID=1745969 RepID=A0AAD6SBM6_9AGAR|nr:hypothetical protein C8F04DRAFT_969285 [Mycena alexandri]
MTSTPPIPGPNIVLGEYAPPRLPAHNSAVYAERNSSGIYDKVADQVLEMGVDAFANIDYTKDYTRHVEDWSKNHRFMDRSGNELRTAVVGEILGPAMGTMLRAQGNYYAHDGDDFKPVDDKAKIKDTIALGVPTQASVKMYNTFLNQVIGANQIVTANANEDTRNGRHPIVKNWSKAGIEGSDTHNVLMLTMLPKYGCLPVIPKRNPVVQSNLFPSIIDDEHPIYFLSSVVSALDIKLGAFYEPSVLQDYGGSYFNHTKAKLVQLDVRNIKNELIPPWEFYEALRPGTLVLWLVSLHCFSMTDDGGKERKERKVYQMNAHSIRVLSESDELVEPRTRPIAPNSPERSVAALPKRAVASSFANFEVPVVVSTPAPDDSPGSAGSGATLDDMVVDDTKVIKTKHSKN